MISQAMRNGVVGSPAESPTVPLWKPDLYKLQEEAPRPRQIPYSGLLSAALDHSSSSRLGPAFHGPLSHQSAATLLSQSGDYLLRLSGTSNTLTLSLRFRDKVKHYRLYYAEAPGEEGGGCYWVREGKKFDTVGDLVRDGLVTLHLEAEAGDYIQLMSDVVKYERSPAYLTLSRYKRRTQPLKPTTEEAEESVHYDKPHNFKTHNFKGLNWCEFCSNFLWGFSAQGVKCEEEAIKRADKMIKWLQERINKILKSLREERTLITDCGFSAHSKCSEKLPPDCCPELKSSRSVFGVDLTTLLKARRTLRPFLVDKCVSEIEARGLTVEGIYRISGFQDEMDTLRAALEDEGEAADLSAAVYENINVVAGVLKQYFRCLPIPLLTYEVHPPLIRAVQLSSVEEQIRASREALTLLPPAHFNTLKYLMAHLAKVDSLQNVNKMSAFNLSTVLAPTLMPPSSASCDPLSGGIPDMSAEIKALSLLILHHQHIFS